MRLSPVGVLQSFSPATVSMAFKATKECATFVRWRRLFQLAATLALHSYLHKIFIEQDPAWKMGADFPKPSKLPPRRRQLIEPQNKAYHNNHIVICSRGTNAYYLSPPTRSWFWWEGDEVLGKTSCRLFSRIFSAGGPHFSLLLALFSLWSFWRKKAKNILPKFDQKVALKGTLTRSVHLFPLEGKIIYRAFGRQCVQTWNSSRLVCRA